MMSSETNTSYLTVVRNKAFRSLWFGQLCSQLGVTMIMFLLALHIYQLTVSSTAVSILFLMFGIPSLLFGMAAGTIVDHFDKRTILIFCDIVRAILVVGLVIFSGSIAAIYIFSVLLASITQLYVPSEAPSIPRLVLPSQLVTANSLFAFTYYGSLAVGAIIAGPLLRLFGSTGALFFICCMFFLAASQSSRIPKEKGKKSLWEFSFPTPGRAVTVMVKQMKEGLVYISSTRKLLDAMVLLTGTQITVAMLATLGPAFADRMLRIDIRDSSIIIVGPVVAGLLVGAVWVGNQGYKIGAAHLIRFGILSAGILLICIALTVRGERSLVFASLYAGSTVLVVEIILFFLLGIANSLLDVPANSVLQSESSGDMRGRVYGLLTSAVGGVGMLPVVAGGILADSLGVGKVIFFLGIIITIYGIIRMKWGYVLVGNKKAL